MIILITQIYANIPSPTLTPYTLTRMRYVRRKMYSCTPSSPLPLHYHPTLLTPTLPPPHAGSMFVHPPHPSPYTLTLPFSPLHSSLHIQVVCSKEDVLMYTLTSTYPLLTRSRSLILLTPPPTLSPYPSYPYPLPPHTGGMFEARCIRLCLCRSARLPSLLSQVLQRTHPHTYSSRRVQTRL